MPGQPLPPLPTTGPQLLFQSGRSRPTPPRTQPVRHRAAVRRQQNLAHPPALEASRSRSPQPTAADHPSRPSCAPTASAGPLCATSTSTTASAAPATRPGRGPPDEHDDQHDGRRPRLPPVRSPRRVVRRTAVAQRPALLRWLHRAVAWEWWRSRRSRRSRRAERNNNNMITLPLAAPGDDPCADCRGSLDGCRARRAARAGRCCRRCSHDSDEDPFLFDANTNGTTPGIVSNPLRALK